MIATNLASTPWSASAPDPELLAAALGCSDQTVEELLDLLGSPRQLTGAQKVSIAVALAIQRQTDVDLPVAAAIVRGHARLCESILSTLDFHPPALGDPAGAERDPFMFFVPHAAEALAVPAIDEFLDVLDGRRVLWRRPRRDAYRLALELQRLSDAARSNIPALHQEYLEFLPRLRGRIPQVSEWIGTIRDGTFRPAPDRFAEPSPSMRQGPNFDAVPVCPANAYGACVSINASLAARCFKRRMLGLEVTDPSASRSKAHPHTNAAVSG